MAEDRVEDVRDGGPRDLLVRALRSLDDVTPARPLWPHQRDCLAALAIHFGRPEAAGRAYVVIPSAGGKTGVFCPMVGAYDLAARSRSLATRAIVLTPAISLVGQVVREFQSRHPHVDVAQASSRTVAGLPSRVPDGWRGVTVLTYAGFARMVDEGRLGAGHVDLIVMDEAHRGLSEVRRDRMAPFFARCAVVAFSATPRFDERKSLDLLFGSGNRAYEVDTQRLRDQGVLAPIVNYVLAVRIEGRFPSDAGLAAHARNKAVVDEVVAFLASHADGVLGTSMADKPMLFFGSDVGHARMFAAEWNRVLGRPGRRMEVLSGQDGIARQEDVLARLGDGSIAGVANASLLTEGVDVPRIGLVANAPTSSVVDVVQQGGRAQRVDQALPFDHPGQQSFVLDTYVEVNGKVHGRPRWYFEAAECAIRPYVVTRASLRVEDIDVSAYDPATDDPAVDDLAADGLGDGDRAATAAPVTEGTADAGGANEVTDDAAVRAGDAVASPNAAERTARAGGQLRLPLQPPVAPHPGPVVQDRGDFVVSHSVEDVRYLLRNRDLAEADGPYGEQWNTREDMFPDGAPAQVDAFLRDLFGEHDVRRRMRAGRTPILRRYDRDGATSEPVRIKVSLRVVGGRPVHCVHSNSVHDLLRVSGARLPGGPLRPGWVTLSDLRRASGNGWDAVRGVVGDAVRVFLVQERVTAKPVVMLGSGVVRMARVTRGSSGGSTLAIDRHSMGVIRDAVLLGSNGPPVDGLSRDAVAKLLGIARSHQGLCGMFQTFEGRLRSGVPAAWDGEAYDASLCTVGGARLVLVAQADLERIRVALRVPLPARDGVAASALPTRDGNWLSRVEALSNIKAKAGANAPAERWWEEFEAAPEVRMERSVAVTRPEAGVRTVKVRMARMWDPVEGEPGTFVHSVDVRAAESSMRDLGLFVREARRLNDLSSRWVSRSELPRLLGGRPDVERIGLAWEELEASTFGTGRPHAFGRPVRAVMVEEGGVPSVRVHHYEVPSLRERLTSHVATAAPAGHRPRRDGYLGRMDVMAALGMRWDDGSVAGRWDALASEVAAAGRPDIGARRAAAPHGMVVPVWALPKMRDLLADPASRHPRAQRLPPARLGGAVWLSQGQVADRLGVTVGRPMLAAWWGEMRDAVVVGQPRVRGVDVPQAMLVREGGSYVARVLEDDLGFVVAGSGVETSAASPRGVADPKEWRPLGSVVGSLSGNGPAVTAVREAWASAARERAQGMTPAIEACQARFRYDDLAGEVIVRVHVEDVRLVARRYAHRVNVPAVPLPRYGPVMFLDDLSRMAAERPRSTTRPHVPQGEAGGART